MYSTVQIIKIIAMIIACISIYKLLVIPKKSTMALFAKNTLGTKLKKIERGYFSYERIENYLKRNGKESTPTKFILIKIGFALLLTLVGLREGSLLISIPLMVGGFFIPDYMVKAGNKKDNVAILRDLKRVYDTLRIQTKAGMYINDSLSECYLVTSNERLKEALRTLSGKIQANEDIEVSIQDFNDKFNNSYIDTFSITLKQGLESGKTVQILEDLSDQINDIEDAMFFEDEEESERKLNKIQFAIYVGLIAIVLYGMFLELMNGLTSM